MMNFESTGSVMSESDFAAFLEEFPEMEQCYDLSDEGMDARYDTARIYWN